MPVFIRYKKFLIIISHFSKSIHYSHL